MNRLCEKCKQVRPFFWFKPDELSNKNKICAECKAIIEVTQDKKCKGEQ